MDIEKILSPEGRPTMEESAGDGQQGRVFSAQRMKYSAEVQLIKNKYGDLEGIRKLLGLSQRKMAQLLLVDPSAWTRWTRGEGSAPPHIYRALSWYLLLQEKDPGMAPYMWLQNVARPQLSAHDVAAVKSQLESELTRDIENRLLKRERLLKRLLIANAAAALLGVIFVALGLGIK